MNFHSGNITKEQNDGNHIFTFGSNLAGRHGKGAALIAQKLKFLSSSEFCGSSFIVFSCWHF